jgi:hypothetical protein
VCSTAAVLPDFKTYKNVDRECLPYSQVYASRGCELWSGAAMLAMVRTE